MVMGDCGGTAGLAEAILVGACLSCGFMEGEMETFGRSAGEVKVLPLVGACGRPSEMLVLFRFLPRPDLASVLLPRLLPAAVPKLGVRGLAIGVDAAEVLRGPSFGVACADARGVAIESVDGPDTAASGRVRSSRECAFRLSACWAAVEGDICAAPVESTLP